MTTVPSARHRLAIGAIVAIALFASASGFITNAQATPTVWTDKADYAPDELVDIHGSGFVPGAVYRLLVVWPDGTAKVAGNNAVVTCADPTVIDGTVCYQEVTANADGSFKSWYQLVSGQSGPYQVYVYDQAATIVATGSFTDDASGPPPVGSHSHLVTNANALPGQPQPPDATAFESQRKVFKNPRGLRHIFALVTVSNDEVAPPSLSGGLWLLRSTDNGSSWSAVQRLKQDNGNPPNVPGSVWTYDDGTQLVAYVSYAQGNNSPLWYRRIRIADNGTITVGAEQSVTGANITNPDQSVRPVVVQDRNLRVHIAYRRANGTMSIIGTVSPDPDDAPTWAAPVDVVTGSQGSSYFPTVVPFGVSGTLLGYIAVARSGGNTALFGRNIVSFNGVTYALGTQQNLGTVATSDSHIPFSPVVDGDNFAHMLYVKECPNSGGGSCPGSSAGSGTGVFSRRASAANTVESWGPAVQVSATAPPALSTVSLSVETGVAPNRLYAFFATNTGVASFKSSNSNVISWGSTGCAGTGGAVSGTQCNISTPAVETNIDWLTASVNGPVQLLWTRLVANSPVKHYYLDSSPPTNVTILFTPDGTNGWHRTSPAAGSVTAADDGTIQSLSCTDSLSGLSQGALVGGGAASASRTLSVSGEASNHNILCTVTDNSGNTAVASVDVRIDTTPPSITGSRTPGANSNGWNNSSVTVSFTCSDALSGLAAGNPPADTALSGEGAGQSVTGTCTDQAGNSNSASVSGINIDRTAPIITFTDRTPANGAGWNNTDVVVHWTCEDALSGTLSAIASQTLTSEGNGLTATGTCQDRADNSASNTQSGIRIDKTSPTLTFAAPTPGPNGAGWNNTDVSIPFVPADSLSGVASTTPGASPLVLTTEGMAVTRQVTVTDVAGNSATFTSPAANIDKTAPTAAASPSPGPNLQSWNNTDVTVSYHGTDGLSGIASCTDPVTLTAETPFAGTTVSGTCNDVAGNVSALASALVRIDKTNPVTVSSLSPTPNGNGWNNTDVTVNFNCTDTLSGVLSSSGSAVHSVEGITNVQGMCSDNAGNSAEPVAVTIRIDKTAPVATASRSPDANSFGWNNSAVTVSFTGTDPLSGIDTCDAAITRNAEGAGQSASGTCRDRAGNVSTPAMIAGINIDLTPPSAAASRTPDANGFGWNNTSVTVSFTGTDALSLIDTCDAAITLSGEGAGQSASGTCRDRAGNVSTPAMIAGVNIDLTPPSAAASRTPDANGFGWNNSAVTVSFTGTDPLSGIDTCDAAITRNAEGAGQSASGTCRDRAGNVSTPAMIAGVNIDLTPPSAAASRTPDANGFGWNNSAVTVSFTGTDALSLIDTCDANFTLQEGAGQSTSGSCRDRAGNVSAPAMIAGINVDLTPPSIAFAHNSPGANANGWNNTDVTVFWDCQDALSGAVANSVSHLLSSEGDNLSTTGICEDRAGNSASNAQTGIRIDKTNPGISATRTPDPNDAGWNNADVLVSFNCTDGLSGIDPGTVPPNRTLMADGANQSTSGTCGDRAGNSTPLTVSGINIDKTPPAYGTPARAVGSEANANGWNRTDVMVNFPCADALSGPLTTPVMRTLTGEGTNQTATAAAAECADRAGNHASADASLAGINIDKTAPAYGMPVRAPGSEANAYNWNRTDVTVNFTCVDDRSGPEHDPVSVTISAEGENQTATAPAAQCIDRAGNHAASDAMLSAISIDKTPPVYGTPARTPGPNANGWVNSDVTVNFPCTDDRSGPLTNPVPVIMSSEGDNQTATALAVQCADRAGNRATSDRSLGGISIDKTAPTIAYVSRTPVPNDNGWNNTNVTLNWSCTDSLSQPVSATIANTVSTQGANQSATGTCTDRAGNTASNLQTGIYVDKTKPTLDASVSPVPVILHGTATAAAGAADTLSGIESQSCAAVDLNSVGNKTLTCTATDKAGNTDNQIITYKVQYLSGAACLGVLGHAIMQPINLDGTSVFKKGSTVPAKFRVCDAHGVSVATAGVVASFYRIGGISGTASELNEDVVSTTPDTAFRWSSSDQLWIFNISTKDPSLSASTTYLYRISLNDTTAIEFRFGLK